MTDLVIKYYQYFYTKVAGRQSYVFKPTNAELSMINNFVGMMDGSVGENYLFKYMSYQFYYWHDKDTRFGKGNIQLNWIIGKKAYERYNINKEEHWRSYSSTLGDKFGVRKDDLIQNSVPKGWIIDSVAHEEDDKLMYHNTDNGLLFCSDYTSMYSPNSNACITCISSAKCISIMKDRYITVYNRRMEASVDKVR